MNPARSTYQDAKRLNRSNQHGSIERTTLTGNPLNSSHPRQPPQTEKMARVIINALQKLSTESKRYSTSSTLKPNQKTLISAISTFLGSIDGHFSSSDLQIDMIIDLFKMLGYPNNISKTIFQPIGAPHSWPACLQMLEWLAQLAEFHFIVKSHLEENHFEDDLNNKILDGYEKEDSSNVLEFLTEQTRTAEREIQDLRFSYETKQLAIRNLNATQKDIEQLDAEIAKQNEIYLRTKEEVIEIEQQNHKIKIETAKIQQEINEKIEERARLSYKIESLRAEIENQEMSVEEIERTKLQIRDKKEKILALRRNQERLQTERNQQISGLLKQFYQYELQLLEVHKIYEQTERIQHICKILPSLNRQQVSDFFSSDTEPTQADANESLAVSSVANFLKAQQRCVTDFTNQIKQLQGKEEGLRRENEQLDQIEAESKQKIGQLSVIAEQTRKITDQSASECEIIQQEINVATLEHQRKSEELKMKIDELEKLRMQYSNLTKERKQDLSFLNAYEEESKQSIQRLEGKLQKFKNMAKTQIRKQRDYFIGLSKTMRNK